MEHAETPRELDELEGRAPVAPARVAPVVVPRWIQLVLLPLALLGFWALVRAAGPVVLLFTIAALIALLLNPFVALLRRTNIPRGLAVGLVFGCLVLVIGTIVALVASPIADQVTAFSAAVPGIVDDANVELASLQRWLDARGVDVQIADPGRTALATLGDSLTEGTGELVSFTQEALVLLVEGSLAVILVVVLAVYMLLYGEQIGAAVRRIVPRGDGSAEDDFPSRIEAAVFGYVRGQLLFSTIMGTSAGIMLYVLGSFGIFEDGKEYALFFGAFYGLAELIPYVGPAIGAAPPVLIALFGGDGLDWLWLVIAFTALQQIEGHIVAPQVFSHSLRINPLLVILALLLGGQLYGIVGAFISLPIAAMLRETVVYFRRHLVLEPWSAAPALAGTGVFDEDPGGGPACPDCGTRPPPGAAFCPSCGAELAGSDAAASAASAAPG
jgi:predicted PurR-regulated permease PerM